jgi:hypothetical protein
MRGGGWTREARVEGADNGEGIGRRTTRQEERGGEHNAGRLRRMAQQEGGGGQCTRAGG